MNYFLTNIKIAKLKINIFYMIVFIKVIEEKWNNKQLCWKTSVLKNINKKNRIENFINPWSLYQEFLINAKFIISMFNCMKNRKLPTNYIINNHSFFTIIKNKIVTLRKFRYFKICFRIFFTKIVFIKIILKNLVKKYFHSY